MQIVYDQPQSVPQPRADPVHHQRPSTSQSVSRHVRDFATRATSRASFSTITRPRRSHSVYKHRPTISRPTNFQHFENGVGLEGIQSMVDGAAVPVRRSRSLRRLELSIYLPNGCGRLSPLPDFEDDDTWGTDIVELEKPAQAFVRVRDSRTNSLSSDPSSSEYPIQRKPLPSSSSRRSSVQSQKSTATIRTHERQLSGTTMATMQTPNLPTWSEEPKASSDSLLEHPTIRRSNTSGTLSPSRILSRLPSPSRNRANTAPSRPGSLRRAKTDVDDAIRELNTIVEERRASAYRQSPILINRPPPSPSHHVPYIAPAMRMHVRSETLSDIGSAFSAPVATPVLARRAGSTLAPPSRSNSMALCSNPITPTTTSATPNHLARLTTWLKSKRSATTPVSPVAQTTNEPFYACAASRPSTAGSRTICHTRQESNDTATVTLFSSRSTSPSDLSTNLFEIDIEKSTPKKAKRVPAPLNLAREKEMGFVVEKALGTGRSVASMSPNVGLLRGMEMLGKDVGVGRGSLGGGAVGVAF
jgi:hypothetical protein